MKPTRSLALVLSLCTLVATGCGGPKTEPQTGPGGGKEGAATPAATPAQEPVAAPTAVDISDQVLLTVQVASLDSILDRGTGMVRPQLPPALQPMAQAQTLKMRLYQVLGQEMGIPNPEQMLDTTRPAAAAMVDPKQHGGRNLQPMMLAVPVQDSQILLDFLGKQAERRDKTPAGDHVFVGKRESIWVRIKDNYALVAGNETVLQGAEGVLMPLLDKAPGSLVHVHVDMATIYSRYQKEIDAGLEKAKEEMDNSSRETGGMGMKTVQRWIGYVKDIKAFDIVAELSSDAVVLRASGVAKDGTPLAVRLGKLGAGEPWGAAYLPEGSALAVVSRDNPELWEEQIAEALSGLDAMVKVLADKAQVKIDPKLVAEMTELAKNAVKHYTGEAAGSFWVGQDGALGFAGVNRVKDPKAAHEAMVAWAKFLARAAAELQNKTFKKQIRKHLPGFKVAVRMKQGALRLGKHRGDIMEIGINWPRLKGKDDREKLDQVKKGMAKLLGRKVTLAWVTTGDVTLSAMGKDYKKKLAEMLRAVEGGKAGSAAAKIKALSGDKKVIAVVHTQAETLAEQVMRAVSQVTTVPADVREMINKVLPGPNTEVPLSAVVYLDGNEVVWENSISANVVGMIGRGVMHAMSSAQGGMMQAP